VLSVVAFLAACGDQTSAANTPAPSPTATPSPTPEAQGATPLTYVAIGASDAFGIGTDHPQTESWPAQVAQKLGADTHLLNLGIPGATVALAQRDEVPVALDANPDIITVWLAVNDLDDSVPLLTYSEQLRDLLASLAIATHARIYVGNIPNLALIPYFAQYDRDALERQVDDWNAVIAADCRAEGATLVDIHAGWSELATHKEYVSGDGFHPSTIGAARIADLFLSIIGEPRAVTGK
jgi:sialate O-acetylesterase